MATKQPSRPATGTPRAPQVTFRPVAPPRVKIAPAERVRDISDPGHERSPADKADPSGQRKLAADGPE